MSGQRTCPKCGGPSTVQHYSSHLAHGVHGATHQLLHGNPVGAVVMLGLAGLSKLIPTGFRCVRCGHTFY